MRIASKKERRLSNGQIGWYHRIADRPQGTRQYVTTAAEINLDIPAILRRWSMDTTPHMLAELASEWGVTSESITRLGATRCEVKSAWAFPMWDVVNGALRAVGIRMQSGKAKWSITGSHSGLFVADMEQTEYLLVCEGLSDTAAALSLGFNAVGRASCSSEVDALTRFLDGRRQEIVIVRDADIIGHYGAVNLAIALHRRCRMIVPPVGKDLREWKKMGATPALVQMIIRNSRYLDRRELQETRSRLKMQLSHMDRRQRVQSTSS